MKDNYHKIIFLNGPRRSGKDSAANHIMKEWLNVRHKKFSAPMKEACRAFFGVNDALWKALEGGASGPEKLEKREVFFGMSWVETLIWFSEEVMKPKFGDDVFGRLMVSDMMKPTSAPLTVISDCGFAEELVPIVRAYKPENCHVFQLYREGHTFAGDSRRYLSPDELPAGVVWHTINNDFEPDMYRRQILIRVNKILGQERTYD